MYKRRNSPGFKVSFEVKPRGWESPAAELRRRIAVLEDQNKLLMNSNLNRYKDYNLARYDYYKSQIHNLARRLDIAYRSIESHRTDLQEMHDLCNRLRLALEAARAKLIEQDSVIENLVRRSGRKVMSC
jgi:hypothetical protein